MSTSTSKSTRKQSTSKDSAQKTQPENKLLQRYSTIKNAAFFDYYVILGVTLALTFIGLIMVLSSSMVTSLDNSSSVWSEFLHQAIMVFAGLIALWVVLRTSPKTIEKFSRAVLAFSVILLVLVLIIGVGLEEVGARSWIAVGPFAFQPSEIAKLALVLWSAAMIAQQGWKNHGRTALTWVAAASAVVLALVLLQGDFGMFVSIGIVVVVLLWFAGIPNKVLVYLSILPVLALIIIMLSGGFRGQRIKDYFSAFKGNFADTQGSSYQSFQGFLSLADGGWLGKGIGQSSAKWYYLPEAKNDFIFAIIGEEMGLFGAVTVVLLYALLAVVGIRISTRQIDPFLRLTSATLTIGLVSQAAINMGYVTGLLPVTGLQLPLISAGGTSAIVTLVTMGLLALCARNEPEAISAMQNHGRPLFDRWLHIPEPTPYSPGQQLKRVAQREYYGSAVTQQVPRNAARGQDSIREEERRRKYMRDEPREAPRYDSPSTQRSPRTTRPGRVDYRGRNPRIGGSSSRNPRDNDRNYRDWR